MTVLADGPEQLADREVEALRFAGRVLELAEDVTTPLADRCRFLTLVQGNVDAFFAVRAGALHASGARGQLAAVRHELGDLHARVEKAVGQVLVELSAYGVRLAGWASLTAEQRARAAEAVGKDAELAAPAPIDAWQGFPVLESERLHLVGELDGQLWQLAVPLGGPRLLDVGGGVHVLREEALGPVVAPQVRWSSCRLVRSAEVSATPEQDGDPELDDLVAWAVHARRYGVPVLLQVSRSMGRLGAARVAHYLGAAPADVRASRHPLDVGYLTQLCERARLPVTRGGQSQTLPVERSVLDRVRVGDVLVHHPEDDFSGSVLRLLSEAAADERVEAVDASLYRLAPGSAVVRALADASRRGARVRVVIEPRARFDETHNVQCAEQLRAAGVEVSFGLTRWKAHAKLVVVRRRDEDGARLYAHIGTGNYHEGTASSYEDLGLLTARADLSGDVAAVLEALLSGRVPPPTRRLLVAPRDLREQVHARIDEVTEAARGGHAAGLQIKVNALTDRDVAARLASAAQAGAQVDLLVRGACVLRPAPGLRVRSITGSVLQHSRIYRFWSPTREDVLLGSADLMARNLDTRIEVLAPVLDPALRDRLTAMLGAYWAPRPDAWDLDPYGGWHRTT